MSIPVLRQPKRVYTKAPKSIPVLDQYPLYALDFDGTSGYVGVGMTTFAPTEMALFAWIKTTLGKRVIIGRLNSAWATAPDGDFVLFSGGVGVDAFICRMGGNQLRISYNTSVIDGRWHFVAVTWDGSTTRLYVDGRLDNSTPMSGAFQASTNKILIGRREYAASPAYFRGLIGQPLIYQQNRSFPEVHHNMRNPMNPVRNGLALWLPIIEGQGTNVADFSGQGNNGTITGGVSWYEMALYEALADVL